MRMLEIHLEVADLNRALEFYKALLPYEKIVEWSDGSAVALVLADGSAFGLWQKGKRGLFGGQGARHLHFAFQIDATQYEEYKSRLEHLGLAPDEHTWPSGERSLYFIDPDGHQGEFMTCDWFGTNVSEESPDPTTR